MATFLSRTLTSVQSGVLSSLPRLLRAEPILAELLGSDDSTLAVAASAQPLVVAALSAYTSGAPLLVVTATGVEAERVVTDLNCMLDQTADDVVRRDVAGTSDDPVAVLPAWETLPFERVSPDVETMGHRLALRWGLAHPDGESLLRAPRVIVAPRPRPAAAVGTIRRTGRAHRHSSG